MSRNQALMMDIAVFEHVSHHNFVHAMSTCQMQHILSKSGLYHTTSSTSSASIQSSGIKAHDINQTFNPVLLDNCKNSITNCFTRTIHKFWYAESCFTCKPYL